MSPSGSGEMGRNAAPREATVASAQILVVEDEALVARAIERMLTRAGYGVTIASDGRQALEKARAVGFDAIVSDITMPGMDGLAFLRAVRGHDLDVPVVFLTGSPDLNTAIQAIEYGAFRYLLKPIAFPELVEVMTRAIRWHQLARVRRAAARELDGRGIADRAGLEARFASALDRLWMAMQPIVSWNKRRVVAFEALVRSDEPTLRNPADLFDAGERLGRVHDLGRAVRRGVAQSLAETSFSGLVLVNLHPADLEDADLMSERGALTPHARRVVLEITERTALDEIRGFRDAIARLRALGYRVAVDDLGAGYAGLSSFASVEPEIVKADMSLVRAIDESPVKQKLLESIVSLCGDLRIQLIVEGIETAAERDCVARLGADLLQGYLFARPGRGFPEPQF